MTRTIHLKKSYKLFLTIICILLFTNLSLLNAQQLQGITGKVINSTSRLPLQGASVKVKNSNISTSTNADGLYSINVPINSELVFSYVGMESQSVKIKDKTILNIELKPVDKSLDEVIVIGYGSVTKRDLTGAVSNIKEDEISRSKAPSIQEALQGKIPGVQISGSSGEPNSAININIRGSNTIYGGTSPLFVIDGIPNDANNSEIATPQIGNRDISSNPLGSINPSDIESVEVLKDASATAIFGARGANGVILITTKSGKQGKPKLEYDGYTGFASATKKLPVLSVDDYIEYRRQLNPNSPLFYYDSNKDGFFNNLDDPKDPYSLPLHNWQDELLRTGFSQTHNLSISGGTQQGTSYSGGIGVLDQDAIVKNNDFQRYTMRLKLDQQVGLRLKLGLNYAGAYSELSGATQSGGGTALTGIVQALATSRPVELYDPSFDVEGTYTSPGAVIDKSYKVVSLIANNFVFYANYKILNGLTFQSLVGGSLTSSKGKEFYSRSTSIGFADKGRGILQEIRSINVFNTNQFNYQKSFSQNHQIQAMAAFEVNKYSIESFLLDNSNFLDESTGVNDIAKGSVLKSLSSNRDISNRVSYFGRFNYNLFKKHLFTATFRADGSDKFGPGNRFGFFPSFAYAYRLIDEPFMKKQNFISNLKIRMSYGKTGNERIPSFRYLARMENAYYGGVLGSAPASSANLNLKWEETDQNNIGLDFEILKGRFSLTFDYYSKITSNMLLPAYVPSSTGYSTQWQNLGKVTNKGFEFSLVTNNVDKKDFKWSTNFNFSSNKNRVENIGNVGFIPVVFGGAWITQAGRVIEGQAIGNAYGYVFDGVYQIDDFTWQNNSDPSIPFASRVFTLKPGVVSVAGVSVQPGSFKFKDLSGDSQIDLDNDRTAISRSLPKFIGGMTNNFNYKSFDLSIFFDWSYGNQIFNESLYRLNSGVAKSWMNILQDYYHNRWTPDNPSNKYGTWGDQNKTALLSSSYYVEDASWVKLRNLTLGYTLPSQFVQNKIKLNAIRFYLNLTNWHTWTKYSGYDPEMSSGNPLLPGYDRISYPRTKTVVFGLNIKF